MREIKVRAFFKKENRLVDVLGYYKKISIDGTIQYHCVCGSDFTFFTDTLIQFTGLKDKEGKEIYEGDILKISRVDKKLSPVIVEVKWDRLCFSCGTGKSLYNYSTMLDLEIEIIGNILVT